MTGNAYLSQLKILYVEDDIDARENLKQFLRKKAGKVVTAADGEEGLKKYDEERPDIVIADILLPGINGIDMLTPLEKKLLEDRHNVAMVENIHAAYYKTVRHELGHIVGSVVSMDAELTRSEFSPFREMDRITFALS